MDRSEYQRAEVAAIGEDLSRLLDVGTVRQRESLKAAICKNLQLAYENTMWVGYQVDVEIPGGPGKSPSQKGHEDPRRPGDEIEEEYEQTSVSTKPHIDNEKIEILNQGLHWDCEWAHEELIRISGKARIKK